MHGNLNETLIMFGKLKTLIGGVSEFVFSSIAERRLTRAEFGTAKSICSGHWQEVGKSSGVESQR